MYAVWHVPGHPELVGIHLSEGLTFYEHVLSLCPAEWEPEDYLKLVRWKRFDTVALALTGFLRERPGERHLPAFQQWGEWEIIPLE